MAQYPLIYFTEKDDSMLNKMGEVSRGSLALALYAANTVFWCIPLFMVAVGKAVIPVAGWRRSCSRWLNAIADNWIWVNNLNQKVTGNIRWDIKGIESLKRSGWYLVMANHQSWVDVLVLQRVFHRKIPFLKFFIKKELFWFPLLGQAWWAMDFPFIKRYSKRFLAQKPHLKGKDLEITRRACAKFKHVPVSIMNFVEGTRFSCPKHTKQASPYRYLLKPKAGGIGFVLGSMGIQIREVLDVTIVYPHGVKSYWDFLCGKVKEVKVRVRRLPIGPEHIGDYIHDDRFRRHLQQWLNELWHEKDLCIEKILMGYRKHHGEPGAALTPAQKCSTG